MERGWNAAHSLNNTIHTCIRYRNVWSVPANPGITRALKGSEIMKIKYFNCDTRSPNFRRIGIPTTNREKKTQLPESLYMFVITMGTGSEVVY